MMGHQGHFLSRLDRVSLPHVELALRLYNDPDLVRYVLDRAGLPPDAGRIALSLEDDKRGPFLLVTADGRFVTCLGRGMRVSIPVLSHMKLRYLLAAAERARSRVEEARRLAGRRLSLRTLLRMTKRHADAVSREEIAAVAAFAPMCGLEFLAVATLSHLRLEKMRPVLQRALRIRTKAACADSLRAYWEGVHTVGRLIVLFGAAGPEVVAPLSTEARIHELPLSLLAAVHGVGSMGLRAIWAAANLGELFLGRYERAFAERRDHATVLDAGLGLTAIGLRHPHLQPRIRPALEAALRPAGHHYSSAEEALATLVACRALKAFDGPADLAAPIARGAASCIELGRGLPEGSPHRYAHERDVPENVALAAALDRIGPLWTRAGTLAALELVPWVARAEAEELWLPSDLAAARRRPFSVEDAISIICPGGVARPTAPPASGPRRQQPCPCGSRRKFKRCCERQPARAA